MSEDFCQDVSSTKLTVNDVVLVGGSPGSGRNEYLREVLQLAKSKRKQAVFHHVYDYMVEAGKERTPPVTIDKRTVLNLHSSVLTAIQDAAFAKIASKIRNRNCPHFVSTPLRFSWQGKVITGVEAKTVKLLKPTKFVVIIDDVARLKIL